MLRQTSLPNISVKGHLVQKLLSEHTHTHTHETDCYAWTTEVISKNACTLSSSSNKWKFTVSQRTFRVQQHIYVYLTFNLFWPLTNIASLCIITCPTTKPVIIKTWYLLETWFISFVSFNVLSTEFCICLNILAVGWVIWPAKTVPEMTYNVFSGTLNPTH